ncbi:MAG: TetR/AcrR family transcriptional regulator [Actinomycetes bacterium]
MTQGIENRIAQGALAKRSAAYASEVRRLLDSGLELMRAGGTGSRPRVSDIVAHAGLSNDAFYRHFPSKDALVAAVLEEGAQRLRSYLAHQMSKVGTPEEKVRRWVEGVLAQAADPDIAAVTRAVLWNAGGSNEGLASGHPSFNAPLAELLREPYAALGSASPDLDATLAAHATIGLLSDRLARDARPDAAEIRHVSEFCLGVVRPARRGKR